MTKIYLVCKYEQDEATLICLATTKKSKAKKLLSTFRDESWTSYCIEVLELEKRYEHDYTEAFF